MEAREHIRSLVRDGRRRNAWWVRLLDAGRFLRSTERRAGLWTALTHREEIHQISSFTSEDRYPELFDGAARLVPHAQRVLSFGCSTGEELLALRRRFPNAEIVGADINRRCRRIAGRRTASDPATHVVPPDGIEGSFDAVFAMAVLTRTRRMVTDSGIDDLSDRYPYSRFDNTVAELVGRLRPGGLLCVTLAHYPIEVSSSADVLDPVEESPLMEPPLFGRDGRRLEEPSARSMFIKRA
jgi:SAM-dependent methyltransferase